MKTNQSLASRRTFLRAGTISGAGVLLGASALPAAEAKKKFQQEEAMSIYELAQFTPKI